MKRKGAKRKVGSKAARPLSESQNDELMAQPLKEESQLLAEENEKENVGEKAKGDEEDGDKHEEEEEPVKHDSLTQENQDDDEVKDKPTNLSCTCRLVPN